LTKTQENRAGNLEELENGRETPEIAWKRCSSCSSNPVPEGLKDRKAGKAAFHTVTSRFHAVSLCHLSTGPFQKVDMKHDRTIAKSCHVTSVRGGEEGGVPGGNGQISKGETNAQKRAGVSLPHATAQSDITDHGSNQTKQPKAKWFPYRCE